MRTTLVAVVASLLAARGVEAQTNSTPVTGLLGNASPVYNNPVGPTYVAVLPREQFFNPADPRGNVKGSIVAAAAPGGRGVQFNIAFSNLPTSGGPFLYHLHVAPVNSTGSCASALAHLDPYIRGEAPPCNPADGLATCQVGDLSGKYGKITTDPFTASYIDPYASIVPGLGSFFGNRSLVVHFANTTRITCANFQSVPGTLNGTSTNGSASPTATVTSLPTVFTGGASLVGTGAGVLALGAAFAALL